MFAQKKKSKGDNAGSWLQRISNRRARISTGSYHIMYRRKYNESRYFYKCAEQRTAEKYFIERPVRVSSSIGNL